MLPKPRSVPVPGHSNVGTGKIAGFFASMSNQIGRSFPVF